MIVQSITQVDLLLCNNLLGMGMMVPIPLMATLHEGNFGWNCMTMVGNFSKHLGLHQLEVPVEMESRDAGFSIASFLATLLPTHKLSGLSQLRASQKKEAVFEVSWKCTNM